MQNIIVLAKARAGRQLWAEPVVQASQASKAPARTFCQLTAPSFLFLSNQFTHSLTFCQQSIKGLMQELGLTDSFLGKAYCPQMSWPVRFLTHRASSFQETSFATGFVSEILLSPYWFEHGVILSLERQKLNLKEKTMQWCRTIGSTLYICILCFF